MVGFAAINPYPGSQTVEELKRYVNDLGLKGVKMHPMAQGYRIYRAYHDELVGPVVKEATKLKVPLIIHNGFSVFSQTLHVALLVEAFPKVPIIMGHFGAARIVLVSGARMPLLRRRNMVTFSWRPRSSLRW